MSMTEFSMAVHCWSYIALVRNWKSSSTNCEEWWESYWISTPHFNYKFNCTRFITQFFHGESQGQVVSLLKRGGENIFGTTCNGSHMAKGKVQEKVIAISKSLGKNFWVGGKEQKCKVNGKRFRCSFYCHWKNGSSFAYLCSYIICISHANPALQCRTVSNFKVYNLLGC